MTCTCASRSRPAMRSSRWPVRVPKRQPSLLGRHGTDGSGSPCRKQTRARLGDQMTEPDGPADISVPAEDDLAVVAQQLGRPPRGVMSIAHRCPCGLPDVVQTAPRLPDGTPFPTLFYLTCPRACGSISGLEAAGVMRERTARLQSDPALRARYLSAHEDYLARRDEAARAARLQPLP